MVSYIKSDLEFILEQIKIAEAHAAGQPLFGAGGLVPTYNLAWGLRTVDGSYNHLMPGQEQWGASGVQFPELVPAAFRPADGTLFDPDGPGGPAPAMPTQPNYNPSNNPNSLVFDSSLRTISNLLVDQTLGNPAAVLTALERAGAVNAMADLPAITAIYQAFKPASDAEYQARVVMQNARTAANNAGDGDPLTPPDAVEQAALDALALATAAHAVTVTALDAARDVRNLALEPFGIAMDGDNVHLPAIAPDEGLSAPFNSWFTLFGQFFDHGLDLVNKGGSGTVFVPLQPDDPLYVEGSNTNFMVLTRATVSPGPDTVFGTSDDVRPVNTTTAYVDQNQTYTSHSSHQVFLRQYVLDASGHPVATGKLIEGANGGMATWGEVKLQARELLGINLTDSDVGSVPLLRTDAYGNFIPGPDGFPQIILGVGGDGIPNTNDDVVIEGDPTILDSFGDPMGVATTGAIRTNSAFLADIAHEAVPVGKIADGDITIGLANPGNGDAEYDNELLDAHFIAGDGRANENIGLTAVHHVFHAEHNRLVEHTKDTVLASNDLVFINEWLSGDIVDLAAVDTQIERDALKADIARWDGERLFQAAKFGTEMQYQHLVFEEFARKIQPNINVFLVPDGFDTTINPDIVAEFAHVVYRFGHSMLTESIDRYDADFTADHIGLIEGFLNPLAFDADGTPVAHTITDEVAAGAIIRGMTRQVGNEIDEFVTTALRNNLLGLPLDLATINLARGRDTGVPTLNQARRDFYQATNNEALLKPYDSWVDFAGHLKHEASIINFIAAYGTHPLILGATTLQEKRDAALTIITGVSTGGFAVPPDRLAFLNATGTTWSGGALGGLENVDLWIGGLAEEIMPFGGMLGSTFNFVFEVQMESLQNGDRFYYLQRLDGLHLFGEMEANSFAGLIMRNTDATHLPSDVFSTPGLILEVDQTRQFNLGLDNPGPDGILLDDLGTPGDESADNIANNGDPVGGGLLTPLVLRDNPATEGVDTNYLRYTGDDHVLLGGTDDADTLIGSIGDDTLFGDGGNDRLEGGFGNDIINGGDGDDIIRDMGGDDNIKGGAGNDAIHAGNGLDLVLGGAGNDFIVLGTDMGSEIFGGEGDDFMFGNKNAERILGNEGNDWIETGTFDGAPGDNFDEIFARDGIDGHDVFLGDGGFDEFIGEGGDDIFVGSLGRGKMAGQSGFDWATYKDMGASVNADLSIPIVFDEAPVLPPNTALDEFESVQGLSGTRFNDILSGSNEDVDTLKPLAQGGSTGYLGSALDAQGIAMIAGLQAVVGAGVTEFARGDIILGGDGSDILQGNGGDDILDGDKWLDVQIGVFATTDLNHTGTPIRLVNSMKELTNDVFAGLINPGQLAIVRTIRSDTTPGDIDTARYVGLRGEYAFSATADGQVVVTHAVEDALDGTDWLRNIEKIQFADGSALNIIVGTPGNDPALNGTAQDDLILGLAGIDTLNGLAGNDILVGGPGGTTTTTATYVDNFNNNSFGNTNGSATWEPDWAETGDNNSPSNGQIQIDDDVNNALAFLAGDGAQIQRSLDLAGATAATLSYTPIRNGLDGGADNDSVTVFFSRDGVTFVEVDFINSASTVTPRSIDLTAFGTGAFTANAAIRFVANSFEGSDSVSIDSLSVSFTTVTTNAGVDTLNGGLGDDTYSFTLGDGNDVINEAVNATSGGAADRISILVPSSGIDPITGLPIMALSGLDANDSNTGTTTGDLVINYAMFNGAVPLNQTITVAGHFTGANAQTGVERINFNGASYAGYALGVDDYLNNRADPAGRDNVTNGVNLSASIVNNFVAGESGTDAITGGSANDLIFGGGGNNNLVGGAGDDLLVGGAGNDSLDARTNGDPDNLDLAGAVGADTMVGGAGNDTYGIDDAADMAVEAVGGGTDTVQTFMAALSIEQMANVENLSYQGGDADQFVGTGNSGNNTISGGDLADTLSGLAGNDLLQGGLGADTMNGGDGNDTYEVDDVGDVIIEANADTVIGGIDHVESEVDYVLGANVENLDLNGDAVSGTGNAGNNIINGNDANNLLFGGGGTDTLNGADGDDILDGGDGNDTLNGGNDDDTIIGGAGDDVIDVGGGFNRIVYNAAGFGNDRIVSFDATGGAATNQDLIDLSGFGLTAANIGTTAASRIQVEDIEDGAVDDTRITIRDAAGTVLGTILVDEIENTAISASDFILGAAAPPTTGSPTNGPNTINGTAAANTINGLGGDDTLSGLGGNDVINGGEGADVLNGGDGNDTLSGGTSAASVNYADNFDNTGAGNSTGTTNWGPDWDEDNDSGGGTTGQIRLDAANSNALQFVGGTGGAGGDFNGAQITRSLDLAGATAATLSYNVVETGLDASDDTLTVFFSRDGVTFVLVDTINSETNTVPRNIDLSLFGSGPFTANAAVRFVASSFETGDSVNIDSLVINATGEFGGDTVNGDAGDDTIIWNANPAAAPTDGRDIVNGGTEGALGDTFVINGNATSESYTIYTLAAWDAVAGNDLASFGGRTPEIVITRGGTAFANVIAELTDIEEIRLNGVDPSGAGGTAGGDTFTVVGDFSGTSLRLNTITIDGDAGDDVIDITSLGSAHRIVFRSNGGHDTIIGTMRPQDVIELPAGMTLDDFVQTTDENGVTTLSDGEHSIRYVAPNGPPVVDDDDDDEDEDDDIDDDDDDDIDDDDDGDSPEPIHTGPVVGTPHDDILLGTSAGDLVFGFAGTDYIVTNAGADVIRAGGDSDFVDSGADRDIIFGDDGDDDLFGGDDDDMIYGGNGEDRLFGQNGNDLLDSGDGDDTVFGGNGNDLIIAGFNDGNDTYYGGDISSDTGNDTLDMGFLTVGAAVDLGTGVGGRGSAVSSQSGTDSLWGVENVTTGSGNDTITMSNAVNIVDGGQGEDVFIFGSAAAAHGDTIRGFEAGDKLDLSGIDANSATAGNDVFTLESGQATTAPGQLVVTHETREDGEYTVISGDTTGNNAPEFRISIAGNHALTVNDFNL